MKCKSTYQFDNVRTKLFLWVILASIPILGLRAGPVDVTTAMTVSGTVLSDEGEPLIGVTVLEEGTSNGTVTDFDGTYSLEVLDGDAILQFSYTGYRTTSVPVAGKNVIDVTMEVEVSSLDEVVVVGYGTTKKANLTGAVSAISSE